ncbi:MAG: mandelate racemase/muconate lactonizing enzyme family protein [Dehalococcoidales bacterium]|nr:mandelate racemase/muconate lactonizing enzyme family protein [Dehalococcoidales bacterium]
MKITKIECIPISLPRPAPSKRGSDVVLIKLHTDEGITGVADGGEHLKAFGDQSIVMGLVKSWEPVLIGADPFERDIVLSRLSHFIYNNTGCSYPNAVALVDFALWDLMGKALNKPIYALLGGKACEKLEVDYIVSDIVALSPDEIARKISKALENGIRTLCLKVGGLWGGNFDRDIINVKTVRKAIGDRDDVHLCIDANGAMDYTKSLELARRLEDCNLYKFEQPTPWWDVDGLARLRKNIKVQICAHESSTKIPGLMEVIKKDAADIVGTKVVWTGGISEAVRWGAIAKAADLAVYCGSMNGPFEAAAQAQWLCSDAWYGKMAHANFFPMSYHETFDTTGSLTREDIVVRPMAYKNGYFYPPDGPGIGLELNEKAIPRFITPGMSPITIGGK